MAKPHLSVIVPAYNEESRLSQTLRDIDEKLRKFKWTYEILVVSDGSTDATAELARRMKGTIKNLKVVENPRNAGKGAVVRQGMLLAAGKVRLFTDADNSTSMDHLLAMMPYLEKGFDVVIASRGLKKSRLEPAAPFIRRLLGRMGNLFIQVILLPGIKDTQCGFKILTDDAAERIFSVARVDGWGFDVELLALAKKFGYNVKEFPVRWSNGTFSHVSPKAYLQTLGETLRIRWWLWIGEHQKAVKRRFSLTQKDDEQVLSHKRTP